MCISYWITLVSMEICDYNLFSDFENVSLTVNKPELCARLKKEISHTNVSVHAAQRKARPGLFLLLHPSLVSFYSSLTLFGSPASSFSPFLSDLFLRRFPFLNLVYLTPFLPPFCISICTCVLSPFPQVFLLIPPSISFSLCSLVSICFVSPSSSASLCLTFSFK